MGTSLRWRVGEEVQDRLPYGWHAAAGARLLFLPSYSPIENAFAKLKALLRKAAARTVDELRALIGASLDTFTPTERVNYFAAAG